VRITSFPPVITVQAKVLVLGSMPGALSLAQHQYYAHPQNQFWTLMGKLCDINPHLPYAQRLTKLNTVGIALWDVLQHCERPGSLDSSIVVASEVPNDFPPLLAQYPQLRAICFNGQKAAKAFSRHVKPVLCTAQIAQLVLVTLPSTSPANASISRADKLAAWQIILRYIGNLK
jgi:double-stranded uracil-DNA glycosylase